MSTIFRKFRELFGRVETRTTPELNLENALIRLGLYSHDPLESYLMKTRFDRYEFSAYHLLNEMTNEKLNSSQNFMINKWSSALPSSNSTDSMFIMELSEFKTCYLNKEGLFGERNYRYTRASEIKTCSPKKLITAIEESLLLLEQRLEENGIQPSLERIVNLWMLTNHVASDCSVIRHGIPSKSANNDEAKYEAKAIKRIYELIEADIKPYLALQSLTLLANKNFYAHDEFEWSVESLKNINDLPLVYLNKLLLDF